MKIKEYIENIQSLYSKGVKSFDSRLSNRHIYSVLNSVRSTLLSQKAKKKQVISSWSYTVFNISMTHSCDGMKTSSPLPVALTDYNGDIIKYVKTIKDNEMIDKIDSNNLSYIKGNRYTKNKTRYYIESNNLFLTIKSGPRELKISMLVSDPAEVYLNYLDNPCEDCKNVLEQEYPVDEDLSSTLIQMTASFLIESFHNLGREDIRNNSVEDQRGE